MSNRKNRMVSRPCAVLGSGELVSHLHRMTDDVGATEYRFNIFRIQDDASATHAFRPVDLYSIVKVCQTLAFAIADDGWLEPIDRGRLAELSTELDELTQRWSETQHGEFPTT